MAARDLFAARPTKNIHPSSEAIYPAALRAAGTAGADASCLRAEAELQPLFIAGPQRHKQPFRPGTGKLRPGGRTLPVQTGPPNLKKLSVSRRQMAAFHPFLCVLIVTAIKSKNNWGFKDTSCSFSVDIKPHVFYRSHGILFIL